ncbi:MAG TPA: ASCH domain-containing protein [Bellilinea sp.]|nr:ASCH domain-containing protein [Bellilinea sp.]
MKGLVVREPWIDLILSGEKAWEMRSRKTSYRGPVALIRKGSGTIVGVADLVGIRPPLSRAEMIDAYPLHCIPRDLIERGEVAKWTTPWVLANVRRLASPVSYEHPAGAVTWVRLSPAVLLAVEAQLAGGLAGRRISSGALAR